MTKQQKPTKPKGPSEAQIEETCTQFLELDGWRCIKTDLKHLRGLGVQEPGMCDRLYLRYKVSIIHGVVGRIPPAALVEVLWIEWKKRGGKAAEHQKDWHQLERARGALVLVAGEDFAADIDSFMTYYRLGSGLMRRKL